MAETDFYDKLDLKYIEIGTALAKIDRMNPGKVPFNIPVLTPDLPTGEKQEVLIPQRSKANIMNQDAGAVEVSDITACNYIEIEIPRELCAQPDAEYNVKGILDLKGKFDSYSALVGNGTVSCEAGYINVSGTLSSFLAKDTQVLWPKSKLYAWPTDEWRYIPKGSKWAIAFMGGDVNQPVVLCRLPPSPPKG